MSDSLSLPSYWSSPTLAQCLSQNDSGTWGNLVSEGVGFPVLRSTNIQGGYLTFDDIAWCDVSPKIATKYELQNGDILITKSSGSPQLIGKNALFIHPNDGNKYLFSNFTQRLRVDTAIILPEYLYYYLNSRYALAFLEQMQNTTSGLRNLSIKQYVTQNIPLPPLPEQRRIAAILRQADMLCQWREEANKKLKKLQLSIFNNKFGNSSQWKSTIPLGSLVEFIGGGTPSRVVKHYFKGDIPWATSKDIKSRYLNDTQEHITDEAIQNSATNLVPAQTILVVVKSKILMHSLPIGITTRPFCFGQDIKGLICKPGVIPQFIAAAMLAQTDYILKQARGVNTEGLTLDILRAVPIPEINTDQQKEFLDSVLLYDELEKSSNLSQSKMEKLFTSISHRAFTGDLTASWREKHREELQRAVVERDKKLGLRGEVATLQDYEEGRITPEELEPIRQALGQFAINVTKLTEPIRQGPLFEMSQNIFEPLIQALRQSQQAVVSVQLPLIPQVNSESFISYIDNLPVSQEKRAIIEALDTTTLRVLKLAGAYPAYFTADDLEAGEYGGITTLQAETSLRTLQALGFVKLVQIDGLLRYRLTVDDDYGNVPYTLQQ